MGLKGLNCTVSFTGTAGQTVISGATRLVTNGDLPEGMLFRRIVDLQEAVNCGGLLLYTGTRWWFAVGSTLAKALASETLGKVGVRNAPYDIVVKNGWKGRDRYYNSAGTLNRIVEYPGGDVYKRVSLGNFFSAGDTVTALGIVTGADIGEGRSDGWSFCATRVPMVTTFESFIRGTKHVTIEAAPESIRGYYERTLDTAIVASALGKSQPTIAVTTAWKGKYLSRAPTYAPEVISTTSVGGNALDARFPYADAKMYPGSVPSSYIPDANGVTLFNYALTEDSTKTTRNEYARARRMDRSGYAGSPFSTYKGWVLDDIPASGLQEAQVGEVNGLKVGFLRDYHVLKRSMVDNQRFALDVATQKTIAEFVNSTIDDQRISEDAPVVPTVANSTTIAEALSEAGTLLDSRDFDSSSAWQTGTLIPALLKFDRVWDVQAKNLAESEK